MINTIKMGYRDNIGCGTKVTRNICSEEIVSWRGNLPFMTTNLSRLGIKYRAIN